MAGNKGAPRARRADALPGAPTLKTASRPNESGFSNSKNAAESQGSVDRRIVIRAENFGQGFDITIEPPITWAHYNAERPTIRAARRYAASIRTVNPSFKIDDQSGEPA